MYITHVEYAGQFIKVCGTMDRDKLTSMEHAINAIKRNLDSLPNVNDLRLGLICVVDYEGNMYRGKIINNSEVQYDSVTLHLMDIGKNITVTVGQIHPINFASLTASKIVNTTDIAAGYLLYGIFNNKEVSSLQVIQKELCNETFNVNFAGQYDNGLLIEIDFNGIDYSKHLLAKNLIRSFDVEEQKNILQTCEVLQANSARMNYKNKTSFPRSLHPPRALRTNNNTNNDVSANDRTNLNSVAQPESIPIPVNINPVDSPSMKKSVQSRLQPTEKRSFISAPDIFAVRSTHDVFISHVNPNSLEFWVQMVKDQEKLSQLMKKLNSFQLHKLKFAPQTGSACIARYSMDKKFYRAAVKSNDLKTIDIVFIDHGIEEKVSINDVYEIPECFLDQHTLCRRFTLDGLHRFPSVSVGLSEYFARMVSGKFMTLTVVEHTIVPTCNLYDFKNQRYIMDELIKFQDLDSIKTIESCKLKEDDVDFVTICYIDSVQKFFVQLQKTQQKYNMLYDKISQFYQRSGEKMHTVAVGSLCAANYEKYEWYRGEVVAIEGSIIKILFIDYGFIAELTIDKLKKLIFDFKSLPGQAIECCLLGFENVENVRDISRVQLEMMTGTHTNDDIDEDNNSNKKVLKLHVIKKLSNNRNIVNLFDESKQPFINISKRVLELSMPHVFEKLHSHQNAQQINKSLPLLNSTVIDDINNNGIKTPQSYDNSGKTNYFGKNYRKTPMYNNNSNNMSKNTTMWDDTIPNNKTEMWDSSGPNNKTEMWDSSGSNNKTEMWDTIKSGQNNGDMSRNNSIFKNRMQQNLSSNRSENWDDSVKSQYNQSQRGGAGRGGYSQNRRINNKDLIPRFNREPKRSTPAVTNTSRSFESGTVSNESGRFTTSSTANDSANESTNREYANISDEYAKLSIPLNKKIPVRLAYWLSPFDFHIQLLSTNNEFTLISNQIQEVYQKYLCQLEEEPKIGSIVMAQIKDNNFHRCKILDYNMDLKKYRVLSVDEGRINIVTMSSLRRVEKRFLSLPEQAIKCGLNNVVCKTHIAIILAKIRSYADNTKQIECEFLTSDTDRYTVELIVNGTSLKELLIRDELVAEIPPGIELRQLIGQSIKVQISKIRDLSSFFIKFDGCELEFLSSYKEFKYVRQNAEKSILFKDDYDKQYCVVNVINVTSENVLMLDLNIPLVPEYEDLVFYRLPILSKSLEVTVSFIESYNIFYVNLVQHENIIQNWLDKMYEFYTSNGNKIDPAITTMQNVYVAKSIDDENYYRCRIVNKDESNVKVYYIDYGNCETIPNDNIYELVSEFMEYDSGLAIKIYLPIKQLNEESLMQEISKSTKDFKLDMTILDYNNNNWIVDLSYATQSLIQILQIKAFAYIMKPTDVIVHNENHSLMPFKLENVASSVVVPTTEIAVVQESSVVPKIASPPKPCRNFCYITHFDSPNHFYIQFDNDIESINGMQNDIQCFADTAPDLEEFEPGQLCIAKFEDDLYYRALITDNTDNKVSYLFIDYGNKESTIRRAENYSLKKITSPFHDVKGYAKLCSLPVKSITEHWSDEAKELVFNYLNLKVEYEVIVKDKEKEFIEIFDCKTGEKISDKLLKSRQALSLKIIQSGEMCYVSNINSLADFTIQLETDCDALDLMASFLGQEVEKLVELQNTKVGDSCIAIYDDGAYYRGKIMEINADKKKILYIDYGNTAWSSEKVFQMPKELNDIQLSTQCSFIIPHDIATNADEYVEQFQKIMNGIFKIDLIELGDTAVIDLALEGVPIFDKLKMCVKAEQAIQDKEVKKDSKREDNIAEEEIKPTEDVIEPEVEELSNVMVIENATQEQPIESTQNVYVCWFNSINSFYIQSENDEAELGCMEKLLSQPMDLIPLEDVQIGKVYAALFADDELYYRARTLSRAEDGSINIFFLDYGNRGVSTEFREIPEAILAVKNLAKHCSLNSDVELNEEAIQHFRDVIQDGLTKLKCEMINVTSDPIIVNLYLEEKDILEELLNINKFSDTESSGTGISNANSIVNGISATSDILSDIINKSDNRDNIPAKRFENFTSPESDTENSRDSLNLSRKKLDF